MISKLLEVFKNLLVPIAILVVAMTLFGIYAAVIAPARVNMKSQAPAAAPTGSVVTIDGHQFGVKVAVSSSDQEKGMSIFNSLPQDEGMLFLFPSYSYYGFWMKNMKFPIDIIWINEDKIAGIQENAPVENLPDYQLPNYYPPEAINKVLEINAGLSQEYGFKVGDEVDIKLATSSF
ncbi:DUF192 domain-containing protein [Patescibacteria group bacterium]|nr:DUF192 domain-containing protein [Patescibacteria group bacterium]MCL5733540.1 DUF192 domain-containing protein [Patescibacteria group bacterium]